MQKYIDYIKDNPRGYWFKRKMYGWGWTPVRWEGWATVAVFVALMVWVARDFAFATRQADVLSGVRLSGQPTSGMLFWFFAKIIIMVAALIFVCYKKGEPLAWQWCSQAGSSGEKFDWRKYQSTPTMRKIQVVLLVLIVIGVALLATQKLWVGSVVDFILKNYY